jgi:hypothetical protein
MQIKKVAKWDKQAVARAVSVFGIQFNWDEIAIIRIGCGLGEFAEVEDGGLSCWKCEIAIKFYSI